MSWNEFVLVLNEVAPTTNLQLLVFFLLSFVGGIYTGILLWTTLGKQTTDKGKGNEK